MIPPVQKERKPDGRGHQKLFEKYPLTGNERDVRLLIS
jgi:hypothetical protein